MIKLLKQRISERRHAIEKMSLAGADSNLIEKEKALLEKDKELLSDMIFSMKA